MMLRNANVESLNLEYFVDIHRAMTRRLMSRICHILSAGELSKFHRETSTQWVSVISVSDTFTVLKF
jgi:hypothetical protein